jgi:hypothetical protein
MAVNVSVTGGELTLSPPRDRAELGGRAETADTDAVSH